MSETKHGSLGARLRAEIREYALIVLYLYVCFGLLTLYKTAVLRDAGQYTLPLGFAAIKALVLGKFLMVGEVLRLGRRGGSRSVLAAVVRRSVALLLLLVALTVVEELVTGWLHGRSSGETESELAQRSKLELLASVLLLLLVLVPYIVATEVARALGPGGARRLLSARTGDAPGGDESAPPG